MSRAHLLRVSAVAAAGLLLLAGARFVRTLEAPSVASFEVSPGRFLREVEARGTLKAVKATPIVVPPEAGRAQKVAWIAKDGASLAAGATIVEFDPYDARNEAQDGQADLTAARARIEKAQAEGLRTERSLAVDRDLARDDLSRAEAYRLTDESLYSRREIIESALNRELSTTRLDVAGKRLQASGKLSSAERALGEIEADKARLKIAIADKGLRSLRITAPHDGLLVLERSWRGETAFVGDSLWPGQKVAELPDLSQLEARVFVLEADGAGLRIGLAARVAIEGRPGEEHEATVSRVEPLAKPRELGSPVKYFEATLSLRTTDPRVMKPGERVRAVIRLEQADGVLAIPRAAVFEQDGRRVVYRRQADRFSPAEVTIGQQSISRVVVLKGLAAGDVIALRDPRAKPGSAGSAIQAQAGK
jgi:HlyD family secretion protein